jgi:hypothetical protein
MFVVIGGALCLF